VFLALLLLLLPLYQALGWRSVPPPEPLFPLRVMTYNIHQGVDHVGLPDLEGIARVIEADQAQIVALQEVPRGWLVNGAVDALSWLAQRLQMHAAWGPAADPFWGNAILSRYPLLDVQNTAMPNNDALIFDRAFLSVTVETTDQRIQVVATHLHHIQREPQHRLPQVRALRDQIDWSLPTILLGDLNAELRHRELGLLARSDRIHSVGVLPTYPADRPRRQLDHIFVSDHFLVAEVTAIASTASDHRPLAATLLPSSDNE